jgi:hypothetical protein
MNSNTSFDFPCACKRTTPLRRISILTKKKNIPHQIYILIFYASIFHLMCYSDFSVVSFARVLIFISFSWEVFSC